MNNTSATNVRKELIENGSGLSTDVPSKAEGIVWCSVFSLLSVLIVVGNLLSIVLFAVNKKLRKKSLYLVINMAFADLMLGALSLPFYVYIRLGMDYYQFWTGMNMPIRYLYFIADSVSTPASLISAAFISCDRLYAIYRPFKHRTLAVRTYRIVIFIVWMLPALDTGLGFLIQRDHFIYARVLLCLTLTIIICGCNIELWRRFQHRGVVSQQQRNRDSQNERLTKTLMFVSVLALLCWLPAITVNGLFSQGIAIPLRYIVIARFLNYSNAFVNPVVYALRLQEFRQALALCCFRRREAVNTENIEIENNKAAALTPATRLRTLQTDSNHLQLKFEQEVMRDTKL